jgi:DNA-binding CsgD family transcriptional regulator
MLDVIRSSSEHLGNGATATIADIAEVILELSEGNYTTARNAAVRVIELDPASLHSRVLPDLVEAATRAGDNHTAGDALAMLEDRATASATPWALGLLARSRALLSNAEAADARYREAITTLESTSAASDLARAHLVYGEFLRRARRISDARTHLRTAHDQFIQIGALGFATRARGELAATGERARVRSVETQLDLTPQEEQIARLAAMGDTNAEIAEKLFISARTVDYHLRKVYRKLGVASRRDLPRRFA